MSDYTRELSKDILERLQTQKMVGNQAGDSQADISIAEALTLLAEIERLHDELRDTHQRYHDRISRITAGWRKRRMARIRAEKEEAWSEGFSAGHDFGAQQMSFYPPEPNPYRKEETK